MKYLENPFTENYYRVKDIFLGPEMNFIPWICTPTTSNVLNGFRGFIESPSYAAFGHTIFARGDNDYEHGKNVSKYGDCVKEVIREILNHNGINLNNVYRASFNLVFPQGDLGSDPHVDHTFNHQVLILHIISEPDSGNTVICENEYPCRHDHHHDYPAVCPNATPLHEMVPLEDHAFTFPGNVYHFTRPSKKPRITLVATYD